MMGNSWLLLAHLQNSCGCCCRPETAFTMDAGLISQAEAPSQSDVDRSKSATCRLALWCPPWRLCELEHFLMLPYLHSFWNWCLASLALSLHPSVQIFTLVHCFQKPLVLGSPKGVVFMAVNETLILLHSQKAGGQRQRQGELHKTL